jgi:hypothetical protein
VVFAETRTDLTRKKAKPPPGGEGFVRVHRRLLS